MLIDDYSNQAKKFLKKVDKDLRKRISNKVDGLLNSPFGYGSKKIRGKDFGDCVYRIRIGTHRILYEVDFDKNVLFVIKIEKRSGVYKIRDEDF